MKRTLILIAVVLAAAAVASPLANPYRGTWPEIFQRFDHRTHQRILKRRGLSCEACHQVGVVAGSDPAPGAAEPTPLLPPPQACHYCHNPPAGERRDGPGSCGLCHDSVQAPVNHGAGWLAGHGADARTGRKVCADCHSANECVDCHERKEGARFAVHDRTWISVHGIAALAQPASCSSCHLQSDCVACHTTGDGRTP